MKVLPFPGTLKVESKGKSNLDNTIEIQIPEGKTFEEAEIKVDAGSGTVDRLEAKELDAEVNAGDLTFYEKITAKKVTLDVDAGNIDTDLSLQIVILRDNTTDKS